MAAPGSLCLISTRNICHLLGVGKGVPWLRRWVGSKDTQQPAPASGNPESLISSLSGTQHELARFYMASPILASKQFLSPCFFSVAFLGL